MEKLLQREPWAGPGAINRHSNHISAVSLLHAELWMHVVSGPTKNLKLRSCFIWGRGEKKKGCRTLSKLQSRARTGQAFQEGFHLNFNIEYHVVSASP